MFGTVAVTDFGWYEQLYESPELDEVNFWKPSSRRAFHAPELSPFFFKLKAPHNAICGFGVYTGYYPLPIWLAWESFGRKNGCRSLPEMRARLEAIRDRIGFAPDADAHKIGCITVNAPVFFAREDWIPQPRDWPARTVGDKKYDLTVGEGARVWRACEEALRGRQRATAVPRVAEPAPRFAEPALVARRLGQGTFRVAVSDAYAWGCAATGEHSLPALEAAHIKPVAEAGPSAVSNGLLLRADLHRLFDRGYLTVDERKTILVSARLKHDFNNGRAYYPYHGKPLRDPVAPRFQPDPAYLRWHNENVFLG